MDIYTEREYEGSRIVYCGNEDCVEFEQEDWADVSIVAYNYREHWKWECPKCNYKGEFEGDEILDEPDYDPYDWH